MNSKSQKIYSFAIFVFAGILYVYFLGGFLRPKQNDQAHAIGMINMSGGVAFHPVEFELGKELFGKFSVLLTAKVIPPVAGDLVVELDGLSDLDYVVSTRYPPGVPIANRTDPWYKFEDEVFKGVTSGSDMVIVVKIDAPKESGEYILTVRDNDTGQQYFSMPVSFLPEGSGVGTSEDCHE